MEDLEDYKVHLVSIGVIEQQSKQDGQVGTFIIHAVVKFLRNIDLFSGK